MNNTASLHDLSTIADLGILRKDFPILQKKMNGRRLAYLDNAATTQKPEAVIRAIQHYYESYNANIHRGAYQLSEKATYEYEEAHRKIARFINAPGMENIIFTRNCTEAINLVAHSWGRSQLNPGDHILLTQMEHHSNLVPWQMQAQEKNLMLDFIPIFSNGTLDLEKLPDLLTQRTKLVSITHASNVLGTINPVKSLIEEAHNIGAVVLIDGAQSVPHFPVDVQELDCDFLAFSGHKMLGPTGIGVLYGKQDLLEKMPPFLGGGDMISEVTFQQSSWKELPWKFEAGTPGISQGIALGSAVDYLNQVGMEQIRQHEQELSQYALDEMQAIPGIKIFGPGANRSGVISFVMDDIHPHDIATFLDQYGVAIRAGHHCAQPLMQLLDVVATARASVYFYNNQEDIDQFIEALQKTREFFRR